MGLETVTFISDLVITNPVGATDPKSQGDDHIRNLKKAIKASFPSITGAMTLTHLQLNDAAQKSVANVFTTDQTISAAQVNFNLNEAGVAADQGKWQFRADGSQLSLFTVSDVGAAVETVWRGTRSGGNLSLFEIAPSRALSAIQLGGVAASDFARLSVANTFLSTTTLSNTAPVLILNQTSGAVDNKRWDVFVATESFVLRAVNDAASVSGDFFTVQRTGTVIDSIDLAATAIRFNSVATTDFARLSQSNTFTGAAQGITAASGAWSITDGGTTVAFTSSYIGAISNVAFSLRTNNTARITVSAAGDFDFKGGLVTTNNASAGEVGPVGALRRSISASGNTAASDAGRSVHFDGGSGQTFTFDSDPPADSIVVLVNRSGANWTIAASGTLTFNGVTGSRTMATGSMASAFHIGSGSWYISGGGLT